MHLEFDEVTDTPEGGRTDQERSDGKNMGGGVCRVVGGEVGGGRASGGGEERGSRREGRKEDVVVVVVRGLCLCVWGGGSGVW